jgi:hypothetical protein
MTDMEETKVKEPKPIDFRPMALTPFISEIPEFTGTPKPRELTEKEIDKFSLRHYNEEKSVMEPVFEHTGSVWYASDNGKLPTYRLYNCGTNCLKILKYTPDRDVWEEVKLEDISTLYGLMWNMCLKLKIQKTDFIPNRVANEYENYELLDPEEVNKWKHTIK